MSQTACARCGAKIDNRGVKAHARKCVTVSTVSTTAKATAVREAEPNAIEAAIASAFGPSAPSFSVEGSGSGSAPAMVTVQPPRPNAPPPGIAKVGSRLTLGPKSKQPSSARPPMRPEPLDPISRAIGSGKYRMGTDNRFDWCREWVRGPRHTFTRWYFEAGVLLDIFQLRSRAVESEVTAKRAAIATHNATETEPAIGYIAVFIGDAPPSAYFVELAKAGEPIGFVLPVAFDQAAPPYAGVGR